MTNNENCKIAYRFRDGKQFTVTRLDNGEFAIERFDDQWYTTDNGHKYLVDKDNVIIKGFGGRFNGMSVGEMQDKLREEHIAKIPQDYRARLDKVQRIPKGQLYKGTNPCGKNQINNKWTSEHVAREHIDKHAHEFGLDGEKYRQQGLKLAGKAVDNVHILGYCRRDGSVVRYDKDKNEIAIANPKKGLVTYFTPRLDEGKDAGYKYYLTEVFDDDFKRGAVINDY